MDQGNLDKKFLLAAGSTGLAVGILAFFGIDFVDGLLDGIGHEDIVDAVMAGAQNTEINSYINELSTDLTNDGTILDVYNEYPDLRPFLDNLIHEYVNMHNEIVDLMNNILDEKAEMMSDMQLTPSESSELDQMVADIDSLNERREELHSQIEEFSGQLLNARK